MGVVTLAAAVVVAWNLGRQGEWTTLLVALLAFPVVTQAAHLLERLAAVLREEARSGNLKNNAFVSDEIRKRIEEMGPFKPLGGCAHTPEQHKAMLEHFERVMKDACNN